MEQHQNLNEKTAVAISYDIDDAAPKILATGKGAVAEKIIQKAKESDVPLYKDNKLANTIVKANGGAEEVAVTFTYQGHQSIEGGEFATQEQITLFRGNEEIKAELTLSAPIMGKTWTPFSPTEAYKQVSMQELVTAIKNMKN